MYVYTSVICPSKVCATLCVYRNRSTTTVHRSFCYRQQQATVISVISTASREDSSCCSTNLAGSRWFLTLSSFVFPYPVTRPRTLLCKTKTCCCRYISIFYHFRLVWGSRARRPGPFRPRISRWVRGHGYREGETGALPPRGRTLVE